MQVLAKLPDDLPQIVRVILYQPSRVFQAPGVVSKFRDSAYVSGRGNVWVKTTCQQREILPIAGFALDGDDWDGLYLARHKGKDLIYAGKVDHGFDEDSVADLQATGAADPKVPSPTKRRSLIAASRSSRNYWQKSNPGRSRPRARCATPSSRDFAKTCSGRRKSRDVLDHRPAPADWFGLERGDPLHRR